MPTRTARCSCGAVSIDGDGDHIHICHCQECQRRTGAPFGVSHDYDGGKILGKRGRPKIYRRTGRAGWDFQFHFCPDCGSTVYWTVTGESMVGVAPGCFTAADLRKPDDVVYAARRYGWVEDPGDLPWYERGHASPRVHDPGGGD